MKEFKNLLMFFIISLLAIGLIFLFYIYIIYNLIKNLPINIQYLLTLLYTFSTARFILYYIFTYFFDDY